MNGYAIVMKQASEGCDYSIACGTRAHYFEAADDVAARRYCESYLKGTPDGDGCWLRDHMGRDAPGLASATLTCVVDTLPVGQWYADVVAAKRAAEAATTDAAEEAELQRLLAKRRGRGAS